jgi:hypothetical protein
MPVQISGSGTTTGINNGLYNPTLNVLGIVTNQNEVLRVTSTGSVGIGTTNPSSSLQVIGVVTATSFSGDGSQLSNIPIPDNSYTWLDTSLF